MDGYDIQKEIVAKLNIIDDVFFHKIAEDLEVCEEILRVILEDQELEVVSAEPQKFLRNTGARSVILDVLCKDGNGRWANIEIQKKDDDDHQRRVRYNGSNLDTFITEKGIAFRDIPDVYVIYISKFDIFKSGRTVYHIDRVVRETEAVVDNGFHEIYVNIKVNDGSEIAELMQYISKTKGINSKFPKTSERVRYFKEEKEGVTIMCDIVEKYAQQCAKEALEKAAKEVAEKAAETAIAMLDDGMDESLVIKYIGLTEAQIRNIQNKRRRR